MACESSEELLFFDTFSHQNLENPEVNLDLVHFAIPVRISEIRIIPLGSKVEADFPGGFRLGATNPSRFNIDFFINDLTKPALSSFENFGTLQYDQNACIHLDCENAKQLPTDGLILKGCYSAITIAVYGSVTRDLNETATKEIPKSSASSTASPPSTQLPSQLQTTLPSVASVAAVAPSSCGLKLTAESLVDQSKLIVEDTAEQKNEQKKAENSKEDDESNVAKVKIETGAFELILSDDDDEDEGDNDGDGDDLAEENGNGDGNGKDGQAALILENIGDPSVTTETDDHDSFDYDLLLSSEEELKVYDPFSYEFPSLSDETRLRLAQNDANSFIELFKKKFKHFNESKSHNDKFVMKIEQIDAFLQSNKASFVAFIKDRTKRKEPISIGDKYFLNAIQHCTQFGLNFQLAMNQAQLAFKVRHLKSTFRLLDTCLDNDADFVDLLPEQFLLFTLNQLFHLFQQEYMAQSLKLAILRILDHILNSKSGIRMFSQIEGYKKIINLLSLADKQKSSLIRLKVSIESILNKIHLFELLSEFKSFIENDNQKEIEGLFETVVLNFSNETCLNYTQQVRFLPVSQQFEIDDFLKSEFLYHRLIVRYFRITGFLPSAILVLTTERGSSKIFASIVHILDALLKTKFGFEYLLEDCDSLNLLLKILLRQPNQMPGLKTSYMLQCYYQLTYELESSNHTDVYNFLYCMTYSSIGKVCVAQVLAVVFDEFVEKLIDNRSCLVNVAYLLDLMQITFVHGNDMHFVGKSILFWRIREVLQKIETVDTDIINKNVVKDLSDITDILTDGNDEKSSIVNENNIPKLVEVLQKILETTTINRIRPVLIFVLRLLCERVSLSETENDMRASNYRQLKYQYFAIQMYSHDVANLLLCYLDKICTTYSHVTACRSILNTTNFQMVLITVNLSLKLINCILRAVTKERKEQFKDLTAIPTLLKMYSLLTSILMIVKRHQQAVAIEQSADRIVDILLTFTYTTTECDESGSEDYTSKSRKKEKREYVSASTSDTEMTTIFTSGNASGTAAAVDVMPSSICNDEYSTKTTWTQMIGQVIKFAFSLPNRFVATMKLLTELLPLSLPISVTAACIQIAPNELAILLRLRKQWSNNLLFHNSDLHRLINCFSRSRDRQLLRFLERFCGQVADLSADSALMIGRILLRILSDGENRNDAFVWSFLSCCLQQPSIKIAVLNLVEDEAFRDVFHDILSATLTIDKTECVLTIIQALCDSEIGLTGNVCDSMPSQQLLQTFISILLKLWNDQTSLVHTLSMILRIFLLLTEHDFGFFHLKEQIVRESSHNNFLGRVIETLEPSKVTKDFLVVLSQFLKNCLTTSGSNRTLKMSFADMKLLLNWNDGQRSHFLSLFEKYSDLIELVNGSLLLLDAEENVKEEGEESNISEILAPFKCRCSLEQQFDKRQVVSLVENGSNDGENSIDFWFGSSHSANEDEAEDVANNTHTDRKFLIEIDLLDLYQKNVTSGGVSLKQLVENLYKCKDEKDNANESTTKPNISGPNKDKQMLLTASKQQMFSRVGPSSMVQRTDSFRSRPPNTSRPPSLHVDDFLALETCGAQPTGPTGYNKTSREFFNSRVIARTRNFISNESNYYAYNKRLDMSAAEAQFHHFYASSPYAYLRAELLRPPPPPPILNPGTLNLRYPFSRMHD